jgi:hypothetical protein
MKLITLIELAIILIAALIVLTGRCTFLSPFLGGC